MRTEVPLSSENKSFATMKKRCSRPETGHEEGDGEQLEQP
jgi:hypothetical protein